MPLLSVHIHTYIYYSTHTYILLYNTINTRKLFNFKKFARLGKFCEFLRQNADFWVTIRPPRAREPSERRHAKRHSENSIKPMPIFAYFAFLEKLRVVFHGRSVPDLSTIQHSPDSNKACNFLVCDGLQNEKCCIFLGFFHV